MFQNGPGPGSDCLHVSVVNIETVVNAEHVSNNPPKVKGRSQIILVQGQPEEIRIGNCKAKEAEQCQHHVPLVDKSNVVLLRGH